MNWLEYLGWDQQQLNDLQYIGYSYLTQGKYDIATKFFRALVVFDPNNAYNHEVLGAIYLETGKALDALGNLDKALKLQPENFLTQLNKTKALFNLGYKKQALALAKSLQACDNKIVADQALALVLAYS
jgi:predicted Zn-dependent protease